MLKKTILTAMLVILCGAAGFAQSSHTVKKGESLGEIAEKYQIKKDSLIKWNSIKNENLIREGQVLKLESPNPSLKEKSETDKQVETSQTNEQPTEETGPEVEKTVNPKKSWSWWWFWLLLGIVSGVFCWEKRLRGKFLPLFNKKKEQSYQLYIDELKKGKQESKEEIERLKSKIKMLEKQNKEFLEENIEMEQKIEGYEYKPKQSFIAEALKPPHTTVRAADDNAVSSNATTLYADGIIEGFFSTITDTPNSDTIFELQIKNAQFADFTIYYDAAELVVQRPEFLDGCEKQVVGSRKIEINARGEAQCQADGKWKITKKLNVIIS